MPGNVKSRLAGAIGSEAAATLYAAFLRDVLVAASAIPETAVTVFHPRNDPFGTIERLCLPGVRLLPDQGQGYDAILPAALRRMLQDSPVAALLGADSPGVPEAIIMQAFEAVETAADGIAIGPSSDGGFYMLATNGDYPDLFAGIDWGSNRVCAQVTGRASSCGLQVTILPEWYDIDGIEDLERLALDLSTNVALGAAASRAALRDFKLSGRDLRTQSPWHVEARTVVYATPWRTLVEDRLATHRGDLIDYAYLETGQAVWIVPVTTEGRVVLVRQYRHPIGEIILEVPAGGGDGDPEEIARRELREETGCVAERLTRVASFFPASAHTTHQGHVYVALGISCGDAELETTELLASLTVPLDLAVDMARRGEIADSQSALAILAAEPNIRAWLDGNENIFRE